MTKPNNKEYPYFVFVSYSSSGAFGNVSFDRKRDIKTKADFKDMCNFVKDDVHDNFGIPKNDIVITNFVVLKNDD